MSKEGKRCRVPAIFGLRQWFEARFAEDCHQHDQAYGSVHPKIYTRAEADRIFRQSIIEKKYRTLAWASWGFCRVLGWIWWEEYTGEGA